MKEREGGREAERGWGVGGSHRRRASLQSGGIFCLQNSNSFNKVARISPILSAANYYEFRS